jgi:hypothetical protein
MTPQTIERKPRTNHPVLNFGVRQPVGAWKV